LRRAKQSSVVLTSAALVAGVLSIAGPAEAATTAVTGIPITMENSGKCLNVTGGSTANNAKVIQYTCVPTATNDKWVVVPKGKDADGFDYYWVQNVASGKCLAVAGASKANNASLIQYTCTTGGNETWYFDSQDGLPTMRLISVGSLLCLDVPGRSTANSVNLVQYACQPGTGTSNERFTTPPTTSAAVVNRPFTTEQPVAVIQGGSPAAGGTAPVTYNWVGVDHQWYGFTDTNPDPFPPSASAASKNAKQSAAPAATLPYGYTGRPEMALLADKRVQVVMHEAQAGDVQYSDETATGAGQFPFYNDIGGAMTAQPTVGTYRPGQLAIYAIINGALWYDPETVGNVEAPIAGWRSLGGTGLTGIPAITPNGAGAQIFAATTAGQIQTATLNINTLSTWTTLGGTGLGNPDVVGLKGDKTFVTARAADGSVVYKEQSTDGTWPADWTTIAGVTAAGNPSAVIGSADGTLDVAIRGTDSQIYVAQETAPASGQFGGWVQVTDPATDPAALSDPTSVGYNVPSGQSFAVVYQTAATDTNGPWGLYFRPSTVFSAPAKSVSRAATARVGVLHKAIGKPAKNAKVAGKK
jgi:hypothetical protein